MCVLSQNFHKSCFLIYLCFLVNRWKALLGQTKPMHFPLSDCFRKCDSTLELQPEFCLSSGKAQQATRLSAELRLAKWIGKPRRHVVQVHTKGLAVIWLFLTIKITALGREVVAQYFCLFVYLSTTHTHTPLFYFPNCDHYDNFLLSLSSLHHKQKTPLS